VLALTREAHWGRNALGQQIEPLVWYRISAFASLPFGDRYWDPAGTATGAIVESTLPA